MDRGVVPVTRIRKGAVMEIVELPNGLGSKLRAVEELVVGEDWSGTRNYQDRKSVV